MRCSVSLSCSVKSASRARECEENARQHALVLRHFVQWQELRCYEPKDWDISPALQRD